MSIKLTKRARDRTGERHGRLVVKEAVGRNKHSQIIWRCVCDCGKIKDVPSGNLGNRTNSCGCLRRDNNKDSTSPSHAKGSNSPHWKGCGDISGYRLARLRDGAKRRGKDYTLADQFLWDLFLKQERRCALSGLVIEFGKKGKEMGTASLDRIDSKCHYTIDNVQWVHKDVNKMKMDLTQQEFIRLCKAISRHNSTWEGN